MEPGEALSRRKVAQRYGCSYATVVEAMVRLANAGLVEAESSQMARVRRVTIESIRDVYTPRTGSGWRSPRTGAAPGTST